MMDEEPDIVDTDEAKLKLLAASWRGIPAWRQAGDSVKDFFSVLFAYTVSPEARGNALTGIHRFPQFW